MSYFLNNWGALAFPIPSYITNVSFFNAYRSFFVLVCEILALIVVLFPVDLFASRRKIRMCLLIYLISCHCTGLVFGTVTEPFSLILSGIFYFLMIFLPTIQAHVNILISTYIISYLLVILFNVQTNLTAFILIVETAFVWYLVAFVENKFFGKKYKDFKSYFSHLFISEVFQSSLQIAFSLTVLFCQLNVYNFFEDSHTVAPPGLIHFLVPIMVGLLWPCAMAYNEFSLGIPEFNENKTIEK